MTHPDLFAPPEQAAPDGDWTELYLSRYERLYRYRIHHDRLQERHLASDQAPSQYRLEVEYLAADETWHELRFHMRRDEIWKLVKPGGES